MGRLKSVLSLFIDTYQKWQDDRAVRKAAALSYYALFSLAPLLFILAGAIGALADRFLGQVTASGEIGGLLENIVGPDVTALILDLIESAGQSTAVAGSLPLATLVSLGVMLWGASNIFNYLHEALNTIWGVEPVVKGGVLAFIRQRAVAFAIVLIAGLLLVLYLLTITVVSTLVPIVTELLPAAVDFLPDWRLLQIVQFSTLFVVATLLFGAFYKILPDVEMAWRDVFIGAAFTSLLFGIGTLLLGIYFSFYTSSLYGAAGAFVVLLLWFYYSAQVFLYGAEFTYMYATRYGSKILPAEYTNAVNSIEDEGEAASPDEGELDPVTSSDRGVSGSQAG